jgi:hypothetical protein
VFDILVEYPPDFYAIELIALTPFCKGYKILNHFGLYSPPLAA